MIKNTLLTIIPSLKETEGDYGVEIEAEGHSLPVFLKPEIWRVENDDSLKAGFEAREYVMSKPKSLSGVHDALKYLGAQYLNCSTKVYETQTSGVHVHINVQQFTPRELFTFMSLWFVLEELLLTFCGVNREGNHFCLRVKDAEWIMHEVVKSAKEKKLAYLNTENLRYAALNPLSLFKYGSLESRSMRGTPDLELIFEWVKIIDAVKEASLSFKNPVEVIQMVRMGEESFVESVLGTQARFFMKHPDLTGMIKRGIRMVLPLAYTVDWSAYKDVNNNPFAKQI